jgi:catechol-2,3-dioxygenase
VNAAFLRTAESTNHHDLGLFGLGAGVAPRQRHQVGLYHLAWQVNTIEELGELRGPLLEAGALTGESSHGATVSLYGADPDGNEFEIMWMLPRSAWGQYETKAVVERLDLEAEIARWSALRPLSAPAPELSSLPAGSRRPIGACYRPPLEAERGAA